jgi:DNA mismatch repair protein MutH
MSQAKIPLQEFLNSYKESLGIEGAEQLLRQAIQRAGLSYQSEFTKEEALKICRELKQYSGFIGIIGGILNSRIIIR